MVPGSPLATSMPRTWSVVVSHTGCLKVQISDLSFNLFTSDVIDSLLHDPECAGCGISIICEVPLITENKCKELMQAYRFQFREAQIRNDNEFSDGLPYTGLFTTELFFLIATRIFVNKVACFFQYLHFSSPG